MKFVMLAMSLLAAVQLNAQTATTTNLTTPVIVATGKLVDQTQVISKTTLFTPSETGLFRVSVYMTQTKPVPASALWSFALFWTDDAGDQADQLADLPTNALPPNSWAYSALYPAGTVFEAVGGQPISYAVILGNHLGNGNGGRYSLYYTVEQLQ